MLRLAICDDDSQSLALLSELLEHWPSLPAEHAIFCFSNGDDLLRAHEVSPFDVILLDIVMPLLNGIEAAREIRSRDKLCKIVFLTSSPEYALESYSVKANNYLLKPVDREALFLCLDELLGELLHHARTMVVRGINAAHRVELDRIEYIEAQNKHTLLVLSDGRRLLSTFPLYTFEEKLSLPDGFFKCHRSYIVNIHQIDTYTSNEITMRSGLRIPISRTYRNEFERAFFSAIFQEAGEEEC